MKKANIDYEIAAETGYSARSVSLITSLLLQKVAATLVETGEVTLVGFGRFKLARQGGAPPPNKRFAKGNNTNAGRDRRYRIHFSKSATLARAIREKHKEYDHGEVWSRRNR